MKHIKSNIALKTLNSLTLASSLFFVAASAQAAGQTIIVDGVRYQAVDTAPVVSVTPAAFPAPVYAPTPVVAQPAIYPAVVQSPQVYSEPQQHYNAGQVIVPLVVTALGVWAVNNWFRDGRVVHRAHNQHSTHKPHHRHVGHGVPVHAPVVVVPAHGRHRH